MQLIVLLGAELDIQVAFNRFEEYREGFGLKFLHGLRRRQNYGRFYRQDEEHDCCSLRVEDQLKNRIESYHQLRSAIAQVGGKKELTGRTDIEIEISNQCARLIANAIIYYNSAILSRLLTKYEASANAKALVLIKKMSPAAWRHIHLNGHYTIHGDGQVIDLDAIVAGLELG